MTAALTAAFRPQAGSATWTRVVYGLFFLSGCPALIYQLTWQRALFRLFGVNSESVTIVVTAFMIGLGLGSLIGGKVSRWSSIRLLPLLALIEVMTAAYGIVSLQLFDMVGALVVRWPLPGVAAISLLLVCVPTLFMGATLPILVAHLIRRSGQVGSVVGRLYYVNTLGAGAACLLCCLALFPFLGMQGSVLCAAAMNVLVAAGALLLHKSAPDDGATVAYAGETRAATPAVRFAPILLLAALGGFISLSFEIFLFRTVSYASGSSAMAFATTLSAFLIGIAAGARHAGHICETHSPDIVKRQALKDLLIANAIGLVLLPALTHVAHFGDVVLAVPIVMSYLIARAWGALLPYLAQFSVRADSNAGMSTSLLYLSNIVGSGAGAIVTGFYLTNVLGLVEIAIALAAAGTIAVLVLTIVLKTSRVQTVRTGLVALSIFAAGAALVPVLSRHLLENLQYKGSGEEPFTRVVENRSGIIAVTETGTVLGNGMYDGRFNVHLRDDRNGIIRPYALSLFHAAPRDVLMIGLSSGSWAQVIANNPNVATVTIVEINPGYLQLIAQEPEVRSVLTNPKVTIVTDDGRRWLAQNPERKFDAIVSNTTWHFRANVSNLLSREFLELTKAHLTPNGILFYNTTDSDRVQRTACLSFPYGARFMNHMVVSQQPIDWNFVRWKQTLAAYTIDGQREFDAGRASDRDLLNSDTSQETVGHLIEDCPNVLSRTREKQAVTDDNMGTEWRWPLRLD